MKKMMMMAFALAPVLLASAGLAADKAPGRLITVVGSSEVKVVPDEALVVLGVEKTDRDLLKAKAEDDKVIRQVLALTRRYGVDPKDVQTANFSVGPQYDYPTGGRRVLTGYRVSNSVSVTFKDLSRLDEFLAAALDAGANNLQGLSFQSSRMEKYEQEARERAARDAKAQAVSMAGALGEKVGRAFSISADNREIHGGPVPMAAMAMGARAQEGGGPVLAPGQVVIRQSVTVSFELE